MLSMLKLLTLTLLLSSFVYANENKKLADFLKERFAQNPSIKSLSVEILESDTISTVPGWKSYIVLVDAKLHENDRDIKQKMIWFSDGNYVTQELTNLHTGDSLSQIIRPSMKAKHYKKENLVYGNANAKHRVAIFSDPLCPFCRGYVPGAIDYMKQKPDTFAIYYYHLPLESIHPAAVVLTKAAIAAEMKGKKNVILDMYKVEVNPKEKDAQKILDAFNKTIGSNISITDIESEKVIAHFNNDTAIIDDLMVNATPTLFFDDKIDRTKKKFQKVQ